MRAKHNGVDIATFNYVSKLLPAGNVPEADAFGEGRSYKSLTVRAVSNTMNRATQKQVGYPCPGGHVPQADTAALVADSKGLPARTERDDLYREANGQVGDLPAVCGGIMPTGSGLRRCLGW